jgi:hypothetical protein
MVTCQPRDDLVDLEMQMICPRAEDLATPRRGLADGLARGEQPP